jgi:hypothetical protein
MPGAMPTRRRGLRLIAKESRAIRFAELRRGVLSWPEPCVTRSRDWRQLAEGLLHRDLCEIPGAEGDALQHVPELLSGCKPQPARHRCHLHPLPRQGWAPGTAHESDAPRCWRVVLPQSRDRDFGEHDGLRRLARARSGCRWKACTARLWVPPVDRQPKARGLVRYDIPTVIHFSTVTYIHKCTAV